MDENPSTGYTWHYFIGNDNIVQVTHDEYISLDKKGFVGVSGVRIWEIKSKSEGTTLITFNYYRTWEGINNSAQTRVYAINVDKDGKISIKKG